ncbi:MAG TPA: TRAP transporter large permease subunit [Treponemataceae bacterium]|nr:TRAP transporter large permease subunit [Treponemataceae bacterium]
MLKKTVNLFALALLAMLTVFPLLFRLLSYFSGIVIPSTDLALVNMVFMFTGFAGIITSSANRHLNLGAINDALPPRAKRVINPLRASITAAVLTALFLSAFSELFMIFESDERLWGVPLKAIFSILPIMFFAMTAIHIKRSANKIAALIGSLIGIFIATGPIVGIAYFLFKIESLVAFQAAFDLWLHASHVLLWPLVILLILSAVFGVSIFVVLSGIAYICFSQGGGYVEMIPLEYYQILTDKSIAAVPLFTLAGYLLAEGSAGKRLLDVVKNSVGWIKGGPVIAAVLVATFFTTFTGASGVTILALGGLLTVILTGSGYKKEEAESLVTASGSIGMLFPPSLAIIIFGTTNIFSVDIFELFKGALIPGFLMAVSMIFLGILRDRTVHRSPFSPRELAKALYHGAAEIFLPICIVAGYFSGFLSLIETAAFAAAYAFILEVLIRRDYTVKQAGKIILKSVPVAGGVLVIIGAAKGLAFFLVDAGIPFILTDFVLTFVQSKYLFLFLLNIMLLAVGCLMDLYSAILVVSPLIMPVAESFGIHPVHTGVIFLTNLALGFLTPPVGMNLFIASYTFNKPIMKLVKYIIPYLIVQFIILMLVTYIPWFSTALL